MPDTYPASLPARWAPATEQDITEAVANGLLEETHYLELKSEVPSGKGANKELARDLAQFAIDGGMLIVGIKEVKGTDRLDLVPVPLNQLSERIEQIAASAIDPPLLISSHAVPCAADPSTGFLVVHIAPSTLAPHMVDGTYYARGDKTKRRLSDPEVRQLHDARARQADRPREELARYVDRDPVPQDRRQQAHLFAVAVPLSPRPEMMLDVTNGQNALNELYQLMTKGGQVPHNLTNAYPPEIKNAKTLQTRADGVAMTSGLESGRTLDPSSSREDVLEVEFSEDGIVRIMTTRFSDELLERGHQALIVAMMPITVRQIVGITAEVAQRAAYGGMWAFGVAATGIAGLPLYSGCRWAEPDRRVGADVNRYEQFTQASSMELAEQPGKVAERLVGRFLRSVRADQKPHCRQALE